MQVYIAKSGPVELKLATKPFQADREQTVQENMIESLTVQLAAAKEVLNFLGYKIEKVDI